MGKWAKIKEVRVTFEDSNIASCNGRDNCVEAQNDWSIPWSNTKDNSKSFFENKSIRLALCERDRSGSQWSDEGCTLLNDADAVIGDNIGPKMAAVNFVVADLLDLTCPVSQDLIHKFSQSTTAFCGELVGDNSPRPVSGAVGVAQRVLSWTTL